MLFNSACFFLLLMFFFFLLFIPANLQARLNLMCVLDVSNWTWLAVRVYVLAWFAVDHHVRMCFEFRFDAIQPTMDCASRLRFSAKIEKLSSWQFQAILTHFDCIHMYVEFLFFYMFLLLWFSLAWLGFGFGFGFVLRAQQRHYSTDQMLHVKFLNSIQSIAMKA